MLTSPPLGRLADRIGPAPVLVLGGVSGTIGMVLQFVLTSLEPGYVAVLVPGAFIGVAAGASFAMLVAAAMRDIPPQQFGMAGAGRTTLFQLSVAVAIAVGFGLMAGAVGGAEALTHIKRVWVVGGVMYLAEALIFSSLYPRTPAGSRPAA